MNYDELYLQEAIEDAELANVKKINAIEFRKKMIDQFIDFSKHQAHFEYSRYFENIKDCDVMYGNSNCVQLLKKKNLKGNFYLVTEESISALVLKNWSEVILILENIPNMNVYIVDDKFSFIISVTVEDNMVYSGIQL